MRPSTVVNGIVLGSCLAIAISLAMVLIVFLVLGEENPRLADEFSPLVDSLGIFTVMTAIAAVSFYSSLTLHRYRMLAHGLLLGGLVLTGLYYWP